MQFRFFPNPNRLGWLRLACSPRVREVVIFLNTSQLLPDQQLTIALHISAAPMINYLSDSTILR